MKQLIYSSILLISALFTPNNLLFAQEDTTSDDSGRSISVGAEYATNTSAFGSVNSFVSQPSYKGLFTYTGKKGLGLSFSPAWVGNSDSTNTKTTTEFDLGASYTLHTGKAIEFTPAFTHYWYGQNSTTLNSGFSNNAQITSSATVKWWEISLITGYGWGQTSDFTLSPSTNATININNFLGKENTLQLQPTFGLVLNKNELNNLNNRKKLKGLEDFIKLHSSMTVSEFLNSTDPGIVAWKKAHPAITSSISNKYKKLQSKKNNKSNILLSDLLSGRTKFGITSINISLPISYSFGDFTLSTNLQYTKPNSKTDPAEFYVSFSLSYSFGL